MWVRTTCCYCRKTLNFLNPDGEEPTAGGISICTECHEISLFAEDGSLRRPTGEEREELLANPDVHSALVALALTPDPLAAIALWRMSQPFEN